MKNKHFAFMIKLSDGKLALRQAMMIFWPIPIYSLSGIAEVSRQLHLVSWIAGCFQTRQSAPNSLFRGQAMSMIHPIRAGYGREWWNCWKKPRHKAIRYCLKTCLSITLGRKRCNPHALLERMCLLQPNRPSIR